MHILVGDIGGTKTHLAVARVINGAITLTDERRYASRDCAGFADILLDYRAALGGATQVRAAALAIAGPVVADRCEATNLPWILDARALEAAAGLEQVRLLNDLEAIAWGLAALEDHHFLTLQAGDPEYSGNAAVIAPGTGLGEAGLFWDGSSHRPFATEGGHTDFAPTDAREFALCAFLAERYREVSGRVSWERLVSGMGIVNIHDFLLDWDPGAGRRVPHPLIRAAREQGGDLAAEIARLAATGDCPRCQETMALFASFCGREAGNLALKLMARGGVYLAGGIAPKNLALFKSGAFIAAFCAKGRMRPLLEAIPVRVVLEERAPLHGAARFLASTTAAR